MSESEKSSFSSIVERIRVVNADMDAVLRFKGPLGESEIEDLRSKLQERGAWLECLQSRTSGLRRDGDSKVKQQVEVFWNAFCKELHDEDVSRLACIKQRMNDAADSVRLTRKRQLLLQYR
jgi:hypothetical protein